METDINEIIDWDGEVGNDGQDFAVLPDGDSVRATILTVEKGHKKDGSAPQVKLTLRAISENGNGEALVRDYITMTRKSEWKLCELFSALGLRKHGETLKMRWDIEGMTFRATVLVDSYTGKGGDIMKSNKIKKYLAPTDAQYDAMCDSVGGDFD